MKFLHFFITISLAVWFTCSVELTQNTLVDKFNTILLLQAYGDGLGAPNEMNNFRNYSSPENRKCTLRTSSLFYNETMYPNTWFIWPPPSKIKNYNGVITDDTSQRIANFYQFLTIHKKSPLQFDENQYLQWKRRMADDLFRRRLHEPSGKIFYFFHKRLVSFKTKRDACKLAMHVR
jgi:ADP-ribosylglycohydrolase